MERTEKEWLEICDKITAGYVPAGIKRNTYITSHTQVKRLLEQCPDLTGKTIVDIGCANGRLPMGLTCYDIQYIGFDIIEPCVTFCKMAFSPWPNFRFEHIHVRNKHYWENGEIAPNKFVFPVISNTVDIVWANSLFTHLGAIDNVAHYISEVKRMLKPGGLLIATWFINDNEQYVESKSVYKLQTILDVMSDFQVNQSIEAISWENFVDGQVQIVGMLT